MRAGKTPACKQAGRPGGRLHRIRCDSTHARFKHQYSIAVDLQWRWLILLFNQGSSSRMHPPLIGSSAAHAARDATYGRLPPVPHLRLALCHTPLSFTGAYGQPGAHRDRERSPSSQRAKAEYRWDYANEEEAAYGAQLLAGLDGQLERKGAGGDDRDKTEPRRRQRPLPSSLVVRVRTARCWMPCTTGQEPAVSRTVGCMQWQCYRLRVVYAVQQYKIMMCVLASLTIAGPAALDSRANLQAALAAHSNWLCLLRATASPARWP